MAKSGDVFEIVSQLGDAELEKVAGAKLRAHAESAYEALRAACSNQQVLHFCEQYQSWLDAGRLGPSEGKKRFIAEIRRIAETGSEEENS